MILRPHKPQIALLQHHLGSLTPHVLSASRPCLHSISLRSYTRSDRPAVQKTRSGTTTPVPADDPNANQPLASPSATASKSPFYFEAGYALFAKRPSRPFPPPFASTPSTSFSEPLSTHDKSRDRRRVSQVNGEMITGVTNGDDAVLVSENFIGANDGVGAWATKEKGHAALWSRLILHFWALEIQKEMSSSSSTTSSSSSSASSNSRDLTPDVIAALDRAFTHTKTATSHPSNPWYGTTTCSSALLHASSTTAPNHPVLSISQLGDSQILVLRPRTKQLVFKTTEQWHWFDCPRQLGTNSPDTPLANAVLDRVPVEEDDVVLAMTDGVVDNLWEHEIIAAVLEGLDMWKGDTTKSRRVGGKEPGEQTYADGMRFVAGEVVARARRVAEDPFAESPYMEKAIDEGLSVEGGKLDDISVVVAQCKRRKG